MKKQKIYNEYDRITEAKMVLFPYKGNINLWIKFDFLSRYENLPIRAKMMLKHLILKKHTGLFTIDTAEMKEVINSRFDSDVSKNIGDLVDFELILPAENESRRTYKFNDKLFGFFNVYD